jgi:type II secretory pathway component PulF
MTAAIQSTDEPIDNRREWRGRWASTLAAVITAGHFLSILIVLGWYYFIVPHSKHVLDNYGVELTSQAKFLIHVSDSIVNYWYLLVPVAPVVMILEFVFTRWIAEHIGLRYASLCGLFIALLILSNVGVGEYLLRDADRQATAILNTRRLVPTIPTP